MYRSAPKRTTITAVSTRLSRPIEWLFLSWWRLVAVVALIALPLLIVTEISSRDQRTQLQASESQVTLKAAERAAATFGGQVLGIRNGVAAVLLVDPIRIAVASNDHDEASRLLTIARTALGDEVVRMWALDREGVVVAVIPPNDAVVGKSFPSPERLADAPPRTANFTSNVRLGGPYRASSTGESAIVSVSVAFRADPSITTGLVAEVDLARIVERVAPGLRSENDLYITDVNGLLILPLSTGDRGGTPTTGTRIVPSGSAAGPYATTMPDPIGGRPAPITVVSIAETDWRLVLVRAPTTLVTQVAPVFDQGDGARVLLVVVMLLGAALVGVTGSQMLRQRHLLAETNAELARATQEKSRFLANMSHELRTPLNAIIGFSELLEQRLPGPLTEKQSDYVHDITESGRHQLALINDILDLSKVEAGKMDFRPETFDVRSAVARVHTLVAPLAQEKRVGLVAEPGSSAPSITHDPGRFRQILYNLLSNAVKFTPEGGRVTTAVTSVDDGYVEISVADTGIGISAEDAATIFQEFKRLDSAYARAQAGTGLGLALVKRMLVEMGGDISVASEVGRGTTFTVRLPEKMTVAEHRPPVLT
ncbi:MAG TPA: ATP-binding protein [Candidatus Limnocylindria bacterium]